MFNLSWHKPLKIGKRDTYTIDVESWSGSEDILTLTSEEANGLVLVDANVIGVNSSTGNKSVIGVIVSGLTEGIEKITLHYTTSSRSDSVEVELKVGDTCLIH